MWLRHYVLVAANLTPLARTVRRLSAACVSTTATTVINTTVHTVPSLGMCFVDLHNSIYLLKHA